jgi:hypothetical protein
MVTGATAARMAAAVNQKAGMGRMNSESWGKIAAAFELIRAGDMTRVDGQDERYQWVIMTMGDGVIRIQITGFEALPQPNLEGAREAGTLAARHLAEGEK